MRLLDAMTWLGSDVRLSPAQSTDAAGLGRMLDRYGIDAALVCSFAARHLDIDYGNNLLFEAAAADRRLIPCPAVVPDSAFEVGDEAAYVRALIERGARAVCLMPKSHSTSTSGRVLGPLLDALQHHRLPLALMETDWLDAIELARQWPGLPFIMHSPDYRNRVWPRLFADSPNVYVSLAPNFAPHRGLETIAARGAIGRVLFASRFPISEPGAPLTQLLLSDLSDADAAGVAGGNLLGLLGDGLAGTPPAGAPGLDSQLAERARRRLPIGLDRAIDMHAHYGAYARMPMWGPLADDLVDELDRTGLAAICVAHESCLAADVRWGNDQVLDAMARRPGRILGYATCRPGGPQLGIDEVRRCLSAGMIGVKLHSAGGGQYTDAGYEPVWQLADQLHLPVLLHTWGDLDRYESLFARYPNAQPLLGHSGAEKVESYIQAARQFPNVWLELCQSNAPRGLIELFVERVGADRILVGSDAPWMPIAQQLGRLLFADITDQQKRQILVDNPRRVLASSRS